MHNEYIQIFSVGLLNSIVVASHWQYCM